MSIAGGLQPASVCAAVWGSTPYIHTYSCVCVCIYIYIYIYNMYIYILYNVYVDLDVYLCLY